MIGKIFLAGLTIAGLALPFTFASKAEAHSPVVVYPAPPVVVYNRATFQVMYRGHHHWHYYGTYYSRYDADHAARHLARHGYEARVTVR